MDYLPDNAIMFIDESHVTVTQIGGMYKGDASRKQNLVDYGFRLPSARDNRPLKFHEFEKSCRKPSSFPPPPRNTKKNTPDKSSNKSSAPQGWSTPNHHPPCRHPSRRFNERNQRPYSKGERVLVTTLTKRMAEQLTDYYSELGIKVRYLHSDIDTVERVEIIRDLRLGLFDVLVGINLLREASTSPKSPSSPSSMPTKKASCAPTAA